MKNIKKIIVPAIAAIALCVSLIAGATFAWFTDEAKTNVNTIQSGKLDVALEMKDGDEWVTAEGKTLSFIKTNAEGEMVADANILWEPGCTYNLPMLRVVNNGDLALKYSVVLAGATGDLKLLEVISFTAKVTKNGEELPAKTGAYGSVIAENMLVPATGDVKAFDTIEITAKMSEEAGNDYKGLSVGNVYVQVFAMQASYEYDSNGNDYDKDAGEFTFANATVKTEGNTVLKDSEENPTLTLTAPEGSTDAAQLTLTKKAATAPANIEIVTGANAISMDISLVDQNGEKVTAAEGKYFTITMQMDKNLNVMSFYHKDKTMTLVSRVRDISKANEYYYDASTGKLTFTTTDFSPFTLIDGAGKGTEDEPYLISTGDQAYLMGNLKGYFKFTKDVVVTNEIYLSGKTYVVDLNGHSVKLEYAEGVKPNNGGVFNIAGKSGKLTINDSSEAQTGAVIGSNESFNNKVTSAVRVGNFGKLTINGGHFYGTSKETACIYVMTSTASGSKATVVINGGKFETASASNVTNFVLNHQDGSTAGCTITVNGGSFRNYEPGVTVVDPVNAKTGKIVLGAGCTTTSEKVGEDTWYTVSK